MTILLLVTWLVSGQPPSSYQTQFTSMEACQTARAKLLAENDRLREQETQRTAAMQAWTQTHGGLYVPGVPPSVSAICTER